MIARGDIVIVEFPYIDGTNAKFRPALVLQNDRNNTRLQNTIVAMITGNTRLAGSEPTQVLVDPQSADGKSSGLHGRSAIKCENLFTVSQRHIRRKVGTLSPTLLAKVNSAIKESLAIA